MLLAAASSSSDARSGPRQTVTEINRARARASSAAADASAGRRRPTMQRCSRRSSPARAADARTDGARQIVPATSPYWCTGGARRLWRALDGRAARARRRAAGARRRGCRRSPTACASTSSTTGGAASSRSATASPTPTDPDGSTRSFYDLLASEARLASFVAIAKGDVPQHHWFHLGRLVTNVDGRATLMSWGGTMFEYLMPQLLMRSFPGTLLDQSCRASVRRQIEYGTQRGVPWGISESAYALHRSRRQLSVPGVRRARARPEARPVDRPRHRAVRHRAGEPGRRRRPRPRTSSDSRELGLDGRFGFYEVARLQPAQPRGRRLAPDASAAAGGRARLLRAPPGHVARRARQRRLRATSFVARFHADPRVQATELLLQERVPREAILSEPRPAESATAPPSLPVLRVAALPIAAHDERAHALPVERPLHHGGDQRRRRLQHVARHGGHPAARGSDVRCRRALHLPARSVVGPGLVADLPAGLPGARPVRGDLRSRQGHVPPPRRRHRDAARDRRVVRKTTSKCGA